MIAARYVDPDGDVLTVETFAGGDPATGDDVILVRTSTDGGDTHCAVALTLAQWSHLRSL